MSPYLRCASLSVRPANDQGLIAKVIDLTFIGETIVEPRQHAHQIMIHIAHNGRDRIDRLRVLFIWMGEYVRLSVGILVMANTKTTNPGP